MDKTIEVSGKTLMFGRVGFFEHIKDASGKDPLEWMNEMFARFKKTDDGKWQITSIVDEVAVYAYAGINLNADITDTDNVGFDRVKKWVRTLSFEECGKIINAAVESMVSQNQNGQESGELKTQPVS
jgi:hypothetical protein